MYLVVLETSFERSKLEPNRGLKVQHHWNLDRLPGLQKLDSIVEGELSRDLPPPPLPPWSDFNIISVRLEICQRSRGGICGRLQQPPGRPPHLPSPLTVTSNYTRMETTGCVTRTRFGLNKSSLALSQPSSLAWGGWASLQHPAAGSPVL